MQSDKCDQNVNFHLIKAGWMFYTPKKTEEAKWNHDNDTIPPED
jgi:hypothetical protein